MSTNNGEGKDYKVFTPREGMKYIKNVILDEVKTNKHKGKFANLKIEYNGSIVPLRVLQPMMTAPFGVSYFGDDKIREVQVKDKNGANKTTQIRYKEGKVSVSIDVSDDEANGNNEIREFKEFLWALDEHILTLLHKKSKELFKRQFTLDVIRANYMSLVKEPTEDAKNKYPDRELAPLFTMKLPVDIQLETSKIRTKLFNDKRQRIYATEQKPVTDIITNFCKVHTAVKIATIWVVQNGVSITTEAEQMMITPSARDSVPDECIFGATDESVENFSTGVEKTTDEEEYVDPTYVQQAEDILNDENNDLYVEGEGEGEEEGEGDGFEKEIGEDFGDEFNLEGEGLDEFGGEDFGEGEVFESEPIPVPVPQPVRRPQPARGGVRTSGRGRGGRR